MRRGPRFALVGVAFIVTGVFAIYSLYYVDNLPYNKFPEVRPRRVTIAELAGQLDDSDLTPDILSRANVDDGSERQTLQNKTGPESPRVPVADGIPVVTQTVPGHNLVQAGNIQNSSGYNDNVERHDKLKDRLPANISAMGPIKIIPANDRPRIFCMIFTTMGNWIERGQAVRDTWAQRCDVFRFFYTYHQGRKLPEHEAVALDVPDGREHLTAKTMTGLRWAFQNYGSTVDWFFKADDDTFVIMENLRFVAAQFKSSEAHYIGGQSKDHLKHGYNGGGAGYLLSNQAAKLILVDGGMKPTRCKTDGGVEDLDMGMCLETFKVYPIETRDSAGRLTFHPDHPFKIFAKQGDNARVYTYQLGENHYGNPQGIRTMSPHTVSFHYVPPPFMYMYDFLLYHLVRHHENGEPGYSAPPHSHPPN